MVSLDDRMMCYGDSAVYCADGGVHYGDSGMYS